MHSLKSWFDMGDIGLEEARPILGLQELVQQKSGISSTGPKGN